MKKLITGVFQLMYNATGVKSLSYFGAVAYITVLHLIMLYGIGILLEGWLPFTSIVHTLFHFPLIAAPTLAMLIVNFLIAPSWALITKEGKKIKKFSPIVSYTVIGALLLLYTQYYDKIF